MIYPGQTLELPVTATASEKNYLHASSEPKLKEELCRESSAVSHSEY